MREPTTSDTPSKLEFLKKGISDVFNSINPLSAEETRRVLIYDLIGKTLKAKYDKPDLNLAAAISMLVGDESRKIHEYFRIDDLGKALVTEIVEVLRARVNFIYIIYSGDKSLYEIEAKIFLSNKDGGKEYIVGSRQLDRDEILDSVREDLIRGTACLEEGIELRIYEREDL